MKSTDTSLSFYLFLSINVLLSFFICIFFFFFFFFFFFL